jgi:hypothetical protein
LLVPLPPCRRCVQAAKRNDVSDSYAKALVELAEEKGKLEQVHADVDAVASLIKENKKLTDLLYNPVVDGDKKKAVLAKIAKEAGFQGYTGNFLNVLVQKDRLNLLPEIVESFEEQYCELTDTQVMLRSHASRAPRSRGCAHGCAGRQCRAGEAEAGERGGSTTKHCRQLEGNGWAGAAGCYKCSATWWGRPGCSLR